MIYFLVIVFILLLLNTLFLIPIQFEIQNQEHNTEIKIKILFITLHLNQEKLIQRIKAHEEKKSISTRLKEIPKILEERKVLPYILSRLKIQKIHIQLISRNSQDWMSCYQITTGYIFAQMLHGYLTTHTKDLREFIVNTSRSVEEVYRDYIDYHLLFSISIYQIIDAFIEYKRRENYVSSHS